MNISGDDCGLIVRSEYKSIISNVTSTSDGNPSLVQDSGDTDLLIVIEFTIPNEHVNTPSQNAFNKNGEPYVFPEVC